MATVLVTAGPTRESLDPVRYLSNRSSGRMGYALARALTTVGHQVVLISGPTALRCPVRVTRIEVESARQMLAACRQHWPQCSALYAVAAVADFRPRHRARHKLKRQQDEGKVLELVPNPDIVHTLAQSKGARLVVGFALESRRGVAEARRKMAAKGLDFVVLNGPDAQGAERAAQTLLGADGSERQLGPASKASLARQIVRHTLGSA